MLARDSISASLLLGCVKISSSIGFSMSFHFNQPVTFLYTFIYTKKAYKTHITNPLRLGYWMSLTF